MAKTPAAPSLRIDTIHQTAFAGQQHWDYTHLFRIEGLPPLRVTIHHDTSYQPQSRAEIEVWTPNGWTNVVRLHSAEVTTNKTEYVTFGAKSVPASTFAATEKILVDAAVKILTA